jgi:hypothetical protein
VCARDGKACTWVVVSRWPLRRGRNLAGVSPIRPSSANTTPPSNIKQLHFTFRVTITLRGIYPATCKLFLWNISKPDSFGHVYCTRLSSTSISTFQDSQDNRQTRWELRCLATSDSWRSSRRVRRVLELVRMHFSIFSTVQGLLIPQRHVHTVSQRVMTCSCPTGTEPF